MDLKLRIRPANWACAIFVFDCAVMPVIKIMGLSVKISYGIAFLALAFLMLDLLRRRKTIMGSGQPVMLALVGYAMLICFGEAWSMLFYGISIGTEFYKILIGVVLMAGSLYYGYHCKAHVGAAAYWTFVVNVVVNCTLALLGREAPAFLTKLYSISVETFMDGYYRNGGIIGNPNSSLLITNMILMLVVVLYRYDKVKLSNVQLASLYVLSIAADIIVSSRGELLHSILILAYLTYWVVRKNNNILKLLPKIAAVVLIIILAVSLFWDDMVAQNPNIQLSIDRMTGMEEIFDTSEGGTDEEDVNTIARPFLRMDVFWNRFKHSPIWGTGIDGRGNIPDFQKGTTGYHNDFFMILGSAGILGLLLWLTIIKKAVKKVGLCMLFPFIVTGISNTFARSYFGTMLYFFIIGYVLFLRDKEQTEPAKQQTPTCGPISYQ